MALRRSSAPRPSANQSRETPRTTVASPWSKSVSFYSRRGFDAAIRAAEKEARRYARRRYVNPYGQRVVMRYLGACNAFALFEAPGARAEVFSLTEVISKKIPDRTVLDRRLGQRVDDKADRLRRRNILNREFSGSVRRDA